MAFVDDAKLSSECSEDARRLVCRVKAIKAFFEGRNVFFCTTAGYCKSIVFQSILSFGFEIPKHGGEVCC